jgi:hypothetical protein
MIMYTIVHNPTVFPIGWVYKQNESSYFKSQAIGKTGRERDNSKHGNNKQKLVVCNWFGAFSFFITDQKHNRNTKKNGNAYHKESLIITYQCTLLE